MKSLLKHLFVTLACLACAASAPSPVHAAQPAGILGDWQDPTGSIIHIASCGNQLCLWLTALSPAAPTTMDIHNPNTALRRRALCGMKIGSGFTLRDQAHASGGTLYDPKTGKRYHGAMTATGTASSPRLNLRGYVGISLFGASQVWTRPSKPAAPCPAH